MNKRFVWGVLILAGVIAGGGWFYRTRTTTTTPATTTQTIAVERGELVATVNGAGPLASPQSANLTWRVGGVVGVIHVKVGDKVKAGDLLLELDPAALDRSIIQAQADLATAQQNLDTLLAGPTTEQLAQAKLTVEQMKQTQTTAEKNLRIALNPLGPSLMSAVEDSKEALENAQLQLQLTNADPNIAALNNQRFVTDWYRRRLDEMIEKWGPEPANEDLADKIRRAKIDVDAQINKELTLQANIELTRSSRETAVEQAEKKYNTSVANVQAAEKGPDAAKVALLQSQLDVAKANLAKAETTLQELQAGADTQAVAAARAQIAVLQATLNQVRLVAPFDATVVAINSKVKDVVNANTNAISLANLNPLEVQVNVSEVDVNRIKPGQTVNITLDAVPGQTFTGQVTAVAYVGTSSQGVVNFPVTIAVPDPDPALKPGMTAAVAIVIERRADVLLVPNRAIRVTNGQRTVTVMFEGQQIPVPVSVGLSNETLSEITEGQLREGDAVVLNQTTTTARTTGGLFGFIGGGGGGQRIGP